MSLKESNHKKKENLYDVNNDAVSFIAHFFQLWFEIKCLRGIKKKEKNI